VPVVRALRYVCLARWWNGGRLCHFSQAATPDGLRQPATKSPDNFGAWPWFRRTAWPMAGLQTIPGSPGPMISASELSPAPDDPVGKSRSTVAASFRIR
jgi:hypothetical protein